MSIINSLGGKEAEENKYHASITLHEILGYALFFPGDLSNNNNNNNTTSSISLGKKILSAYVSQKYSAHRDNGYFYIAERIENIQIITERRIINHIIVSFDAWLRKQSSSPDCCYVIDDDYTELEKEYRRYVDSCHPLLVKKLGISCNDLSDTKYISREIEILFENYRLCINPKRQTYTIQYKRKLGTKRVFLVDTLTQEVLFFSKEGRIHTDPIFMRDVESLKIIGLASFLDTKDLSIKTVYLKNEHITLYQRIVPDNYERSYPFILECEIQGEEKNNSRAYKEFFELSWRLNAHSPKKIITNYASKSSKPIHVKNENEYLNKPTITVYPKYDGIPATLLFYQYHFIVKNSTTSNSYTHCLEPWVTYILKQYSFLVETELYDTTTTSSSEGFSKPNTAMVIIDIHSTAFNASNRMNIIQTLRKVLAPYLYKYFIFFQGEEQQQRNELSSSRETKNNKESSSSIVYSSSLIHNHIYEVKLINKDEIDYIVRERSDKTNPNSSKLVDTVLYLQQ